MSNSSRTRLGPALFFSVSFGLCLYFAFAAIQGDYGLFRRAEIEAETRDHAIELARVEAEVARMENLTRRLSDGFLDLDLLDEQARNVLGAIRSDEVVIR